MSNWSVKVAACWLVIAGALAAEPRPAEAEHVSIPPQLFGFDVSAGAAVCGGGRRVLIQGDDDRPVVARVHVQVEQSLILLLPDGRLVARPQDECAATEQPFQPLDHEQLLQRLGQLPEFTGWRSRQTRRYLYLYAGSEAFTEVASRILETMFRGIVLYTRAQKIEAQPPEFPLVVIVFPTLEQFRAFRRLPHGVTAYYDVVSNQVLLCEESELWQVQPELAIRQSIATIAHEGAHQILHNIGVQQRLSLWPMWLNEGLAEYFAATTTDRQLKWKGAGEVNDLRMFELEQLIKSRPAETIGGQLVAQTVGAAKLTSTGYAAAWALTHYLAKNQRDAFHAFVREVSQRKPLEGGGEVVPPGGIPANLRDFKRHFGEDLADIERRLVLHLGRLPYQDPFHDWPHYVAFVSWIRGGQRHRAANVFLRRDQAELWRQEQLARQTEQPVEASDSGTREFPSRIHAEQFARQWLGAP